ncbi:hypothetical protein N657DRAFT_578638 [Parathielavia appendiculata]|uniref:Uncharacterized protein n=1 Tax=Parathielavia appendiculata TaxID=2587402 RepID=A0AAN6TVN0_9PEZI|nr:hypothetical protein N657DRAFT_578638 [Parathielavia appendiculata]
MTVRSDCRVSLPNMGMSHVNYALGLDADGLGTHPRKFKKHKVLPRPGKDELQRSALSSHGLGSDAALPRSNPSSASILSSRQRPNRVGRGPEPPPTPPTHSRTSSASHPADSSTSGHAGTPPGSTDNVDSDPPATPTNQQTPPTPNLTPERTPPGPAAGQARRRPLLSQRNSSKVTTDSRAESFRTAPEHPHLSDDDDAGSTLRPALPSAKSSQSTVRQVSRETRSVSQPIGLGLGLEFSSDDKAMPRTSAELNKVDGMRDIGQSDSNRTEEWDRDLMRNVTIRKRRPTRPKELSNQEIVDDRPVSPTNATQALRSMPLDESPIVYPSRRVVSDRYTTKPEAVNSESSSSVDVKRSSVMSTKSNASTIVEAMLVGTAPQRRKTLRHVRKQSALRDSSSEISPVTSAPTSVSPPVHDRRQRHESSATKVDETVRESYASAASINSISSRKARRSVWKSGGVPVVVIPDRRSSVKSTSKSPSLRSTSSRRSRSLSSVPISPPSKSGEQIPLFERPARRSRAFSESDGSRAGDERTMDFPPVIPARSSSLSAPTSRNASRTASLTAESLQAHSIFQAQQAHLALQKASQPLDKLQTHPRPSEDDRMLSWRGPEDPPLNGEVERALPTVSVEQTLREKQREPGGRAAQANRDLHGTNAVDGGLRIDRDGDRFLSVQNTPLSVASVETTGTSHAEVSEAMAVNIYPHQNKSVVLVNHSAKPSESSSMNEYKTSAANVPIVKTTNPNGAVPATPPQQFSMDGVDSPLRNPRAPPKPPTINFIPATPSGLTPTTEKQKQLGNYYEMTAEKPRRSMSLLRRALTRRTAEYGPSPSRPVGFLTRTFSLSRNVRRRHDDDWPDAHRLKRHSTADDVPPDETMLHPFWRPAHCVDDDEESRPSEEDDYDDEDEDRDYRGEDRTYRYPPIDNRPSKSWLPPSSRRHSRSRSLSARFKRTFAILPVRAADEDGYDHQQQQQDYPATDAHDATDRRTIRRTPSGNLRVMKFRRSMESLTTRASPLAGTAAADGWRQDAASAHAGRNGSGGVEGYPDGERDRPITRLWRSLSLRARSSVRATPREGGGSSGGNGGGGGFLPALGDRINISRRLSERRRVKRTQELRGMISAPREVRDGVGDVIRRNSWRDRGRGMDADADAAYVNEQQAQRRRQGLRT